MSLHSETLNSNFVIKALGIVLRAAGTSLGESDGVMVDDKNGVTLGIIIGARVAVTGILDGADDCVFDCVFDGLEVIADIG